MNKSELINYLANANDISRAKAESVLNSLTDVIHHQLMSGGEITLHNVGRFSVSQRAARKGRNPSNGEEINIPAKAVPKFSAAKALKDAVAQ